MSNFVFPELKIVFIHLPKCGGLSLREKILSNYEKLGPYFGKIPKKYNTFFKFTIIRNPYTRFVSAFNMFKHGTDEFEAIEPNKDMLFFLDTIENKKLKYGPKQRIKHHFLPQTHLYNCYHLADKILRFENYSKEVKDFLVSIGIESPELTKFNVSNEQKEYRITGNILSRINSYYESDFKQLNYPIFDKGVIVQGNKYYEYTR